MVVGIVLTCITGLLVLARIYSRCFITRAPGLDDVLIVLSLVSQIPTTPESPQKQIHFACLPDLNKSTE